MKKAITCILLLNTILFCSCQVTPENEVVVNKNDGELEAIIKAEPELSRQIINEDEWVELLELENLECDICAEIILPSSSTFPVYKVEKRIFDIDTISSFIDYFTEDAIGVRETSYTKEELEEQLIQVKKGRYVEYDTGGSWETYEGQEQAIADLEEQIKNATEEILSQ